MSEQDYKKHFAQYPLKNSKVQLVVMTGEKLMIRGVLNVEVRKPEKDDTHFLNVVVVKSTSKKNFVPLLGRNWLDVLYPNWRDRFINLISTGENSGLERERNILLCQIRSRYNEIITKSLEDPIEGFIAEVYLRDDSRPIFYRANEVPYALRDKVSEELDRLVRENIIKPVKRSDWASPIVVVPKSDGSIRICVDCKVTINKVISTEHYPLPNISDIFANLSGFRYYAKIDLSGAYMQVRLSEDSRKYLTINTHKGLYEYMRLPFGIASAASTFQRIMDEILKDLEGIQCYLDDILIGSDTIEGLKKRVLEVFDRLKKFKVKVNLDKCEFIVLKIAYLGHEISEKGLSSCEEKVKAITSVPRPRDATQLKSYLGMVNYYSKFVPNLSIRLAPLYELIKKNVRFHWTKECQRVFERSKELLIDNRVLHLYDPKLPIVVVCDSSSVGVGAVLCHSVDGLEKPVFYVSSTLSNAEKNYPNLHREALAIVFALSKFAKYIYGKKITVVTDNKPLVSIFNQKKGIPPLAAARLQKYAYTISIFDFDIVYRKGKKIPEADALSRLPVEGSTDIDSEVMVNSVREEIPINLDVIGKETQRDHFYRKLFKCVSDGWEDHEVTSDLKFYYERVSALSTEENCVLFSERVIVPVSCRERILELLHGCHLGMVRMKQMARKYVYWRGMDQDIERFVKACRVCNVTGKAVPKEFTKWPPASRPFERLHIDFCHIAGRTLLVVVDSQSKWIEVKIMKSTDAQSVINVLDSLFLVFGYCETIVSDNGPPFGSGMFNSWAKWHSIKLVKSPSYCPEANGQAERAVQTTKTSLRKLLNDSNHAHKNLNELIKIFLMSYRNSYSQVLGCSPGSKIFKFEPKTELDTKLKIGSKTGKNVKQKKVTFSDELNFQKEKTNDRQLKRWGSKGKNSTKDDSMEKPILKYKVDDLVWYKNEFKTDKNWIEAKVVGINSPSTYYINISGSIKLASKHQLKQRIVKNDYIFPKVIRSESKRRRSSTSEIPFGRPLKIRKSKRRKRRPDFLRYSTF